MTRCTTCGEELESLLACTACGALFQVDDAQSPFALLGLAPGFEIDDKDLRKRLLRVSRSVHPDYHGMAGEETRALAERNSALANDAYERLSNPVKRANLLVRSLEGPSEQDERQMPQAFLMEVLDWNETLESARESTPGSPARAALIPLRATLEKMRTETLNEIAALLSPLPGPGAVTLSEVRRALNAVSYLDRALGEIEVLRLQEAAAN